MSAAIAMTAMSCGSSSSTNDVAEELLEQARKAVDAKEYDRAISLLDSIDSSCPDAIDTRSDAMKLRPYAIEGVTLAAIVETDSAIVRSEQTIARLQSSMAMHENQEIGESYYIPSALDNADFINTTGISVRVNGQTGALYIVSSVNPGRIDQRYVMLSDVAGNVVSTDTISADSEANYKTKNSELLEFLPRYCTRLPQFIIDNDGAEMTATICGDKGSRNIKLNASQVAHMAQAARLSQAIGEARTASLERERLNRNLDTARRQQQK